MTETNHPNEHGFAGGATAPTPARPDRATGDDAAEQAAVPDGDLTGSVSDALDDASQTDDAAAARDR